MITIGLTGGIGMGKSTTAALFGEHGIPIWDADQAVHRLYAPEGQAVTPILKLFPSVAGEDGGINRAALAQEILDDPNALKQLERVVHPLVGLDRMNFIKSNHAAGAEVVVLDIPLLLENLGPYRPDVIVVCSAPEAIRRERVLAREGMTEEKFERIVSAQMPEAEKAKFADFIVPTGEGIDIARRAVAQIVEDISGAKGLDDGSEQPQN